MDQMTPRQSKELREYIETIEGLHEEGATLRERIKEQFDEAKGVGFDAKTMRKVLALRKQTKAEREKAEAILETYLRALEFAGTPLGKYAQNAEAAEDRPKLAVV